LILGWENIQGSKLRKLVSARSVLFVVSLMLPTLYVLIASYAGVNSFIVNVSKQNGAFWLRDMPIAVEYLVFAVLFSLMVFLSSGAKGLKSFSIPILFSIIVGAVFIIDSVYPNDQFTPFQFLVPATTMLAANTLGFMGYNTTLDLSQGSLPQLTVTDPSNPLKTASFGIAWPCAGIESLLIFTVTIMLFLKRMPISWQAKLGYFAFGAGVTYFINILRIVSIFLFALGGGDVNVFHQTYGPLYPIAWIVTYPLIILASQSLWHRITNRKEVALASPEGAAPDTQSVV
jgi:exosortase/archaeosortase family protein